MTFSFTFDSATGHVTIAEGSFKLPARAFKGRKEIKSVTIPGSVLSIGTEAFRGGSLNKIIIPER